MIYFSYNECERDYFKKVTKELTTIDSQQGFNIFYHKFCKENEAVSPKKLKIVINRSVPQIKKNTGAKAKEKIYS